MVRNGEEVLDSNRRTEALLAEALRLTSRQAAVMRALLAGGTNKQIAAELEISPYTVRDHVANLMDRFRVDSRRELKAIAVAALERSG